MRESESPVFLHVFCDFQYYPNMFRNFLLEHAPNAKLQLHLAFSGSFRGLGLKAFRSCFFRVSCIFSCFRVFVRACASELASNAKLQLRLAFSGGFWGLRLGFISSFSPLKSVISFRPDPGPELPGDLPKRTLLAKIRTFRPDPGPELPEDLPKRTLLAKIGTFWPDPGPELPRRPPEEDAFS